MNYYIHAKKILAASIVFSLQEVCFFFLFCPNCILYRKPDSEDCNLQSSYALFSCKLIDSILILNFSVPSSVHGGCNLLLCMPLSVAMLRTKLHPRPPYRQNIAFPSQCLSLPKKFLFHPLPTYIPTFFKVPLY